MTANIVAFGNHQNHELVMNTIFGVLQNLTLPFDFSYFFFKLEVIYA